MMDWNHCALCQLQTSPKERYEAMRKRVDKLRGHRKDKSLKDDEIITTIKAIKDALAEEDLKTVNPHVVKAAYKEPKGLFSFVNFFRLCPNSGGDKLLQAIQTRHCEILQMYLRFICRLGCGPFPELEAECAVPRADHIRPEARVSTAKTGG